MTKYKAEMVIEVTEGHPRKWVIDAVNECLTAEEDIISHSIELVNDITTPDSPNLGDGPFGTKKLTTKNGTVFFSNSNGIFDPKTGKKRFASMAEFRRFEAHEGD